MVGQCVATERVPIEHLAEEFLARYRRGEIPAITEYVGAHPALADEIRELFPTLMMLERVSPQPEEICNRVSSDGVGTLVRKQLGEYRILREIGRGGMGIVFEAEQLSLGRHVALKVLPAQALLTPNLLTRFQNEARAAARLHHTNIVPVFGVGDDQGIHYYAMQFIQGHGLDEVLEELRRLRRQEGAAETHIGLSPEEEAASKPLSRIIAKSLAAGEFAYEARQPEEVGREFESPVANSPPQSAAATSAGVREPIRGTDSSGLLYHSLDGSSSGHLRSHGIYVRSIARMGLQIAEALAHAHSQGVLHRDIKPSNLLLDAYGMVWITDFGLAKQEGSDLTHSGDVVGTLRYLAPERFRGTSDARTDIYGLGVTLYELLTTRPAFASTDRLRLIHDISHLEPMPPRRLERHVPRDLETIVLKAMAKEPARRYAAADEMAADLRRFLDDQPIAARRAWVVERVWRWCAHQPALAAVSVALLVSLAIGFCGVLWQWSRAEQHKKLTEASLVVTRSERERAEHNLHEADRQRTIAEHEADRAETNYRTARQAVDELLTMVSEDELRNQPGLQALRLRLLTRALEYYQGMLAQRENDSKARLELASSHVRVAAIKKLMGSTSEAKEGFRKAIDLFESVLAEVSDDRQTALQLVGACNDLSLLRIDDRDFADAQRLLDRARSLVASLAETNPNDMSIQEKLARTLLNIGWCISQTPSADQRARVEEAIVINRESLIIYRQLAREKPGDYAILHGMASALSNIGRRSLSVGRLDDAQRLFEECLQIRHEVAQSQPSSLDAQYYLGTVYQALGDVAVRTPKPDSDTYDKALAYYRKAIDVLEPLVRQNPAIAGYRPYYVRSLRNVSEVHALRNDHAAALEERIRVNNLIESYIPLDPENAVWPIDLARGLVAQATLESNLGRDDESLATCFRAREAWHKLQEQPNVLERYREQIIDGLANLMHELSAAGRMAEVHDIAVERRELCEGLPRRTLNLAYSLDCAVRSGSRGAGPKVQGEEFERCQNLAIELFLSAARAAPDEVTSFVKPRPTMSDYSSLATTQAALAKNPQDVSLLTQRSELFRRFRHIRLAMDDWNRALEIVNTELERSPSDVGLLQQRGKLQFDVGNWERAAADYSRVVAARRNATTPLSYHARTMLHLGDWSEANKDYASLWQKGSRQQYHVIFWCRAAYELGLKQDVETHSTQLFELAGDDHAKAGARAWRMLVDGDVTRFPDLALKLGQRAVELRPHVVYESTLGGIYFRQGRYEEAVSTLRAAADGQPGTASTQAGFFLAMSYHHLGEHDQALAAFQRAERNWKKATNILGVEDSFFESIWQEAKSLLDS
jgi:serine/threonine-protein kinase